MDDEEWFDSEPEQPYQGLQRLHIGSGTWYADGWVNVDAHDDFSPNRAPDVVADARDLPFGDNYFDYLYMGHFLEHIALDEMGAVFAELRRTCKPDARIAIVGPAMDLALQQNSPEWLIDAIRATPGDPTPGSHKWTADSTNTRVVCEEHGMRVVQVPIFEIQPPEWCNPNWTATWQCAFLGTWDNS